MTNNSFYKITENEFVNIDLIVSIKIKESEVFLYFVNGDRRSYQTKDLHTHFQNFLNVRFL